MFFARTSPQLAGLDFSTQRSGRDRRAAMRYQQAQIKAISKAHALVELGTDGKILHANDRFLALLGLTADRVCGHPFEALFVADNAGQKPWDRIGRGETGKATVRHVTKDQRTVNLQVIFTPVYDEDDKLTSFTGLATDETEAVSLNELQPTIILPWPMFRSQL